MKFPHAFPARRHTEECSTIGAEDKTLHVGHAVDGAEILLFFLIQPGILQDLTYKLAGLCLPEENAFIHRGCEILAVGTQGESSHPVFSSYIFPSSCDGFAGIAESALDQGERVSVLLYFCRDALLFLERQPVKLFPCSDIMHAHLVSQPHSKQATIGTQRHHRATQEIPLFSQRRLYRE